ncbi:MAG: peptidylprolyl isomerase [Bacteroidales bacterium]|jgi:peptidyl-prolyl cis-trans isomerase SurA|nr:peptidylprolyl isomerase [Bacteroidales bacterium]
MKIRSSLLVLPAVLLPFFCGAQTLNDRTLVTVAGKDVPAGEFIRMFKKSAEPGKTEDMNSYLQQYIVFKLKVSDAIQEGYDTTRAFRTELNGYRNQLAQNYLTDNQTKEKLLQKTYQRSLTEINAWHILVSCPEGAKPEDTLIAWNKASGIRERIIQGESFEQVARGSSDDSSVKVNGGNLGYFTVFQMIMPFEDAAYNLKEGAISQPVRTPYGYHIIKVIDKRASRGKVLIAHIMKASPPGTDEKKAKEAEEAINSVYNELQAGGSFSELAKKYSDHKESAAAGGKLNWFGTGEIIPALSEAAFSITDTGKYSKPVHTVYAWHIIKLLDKKNPGSYEETKSYLESKLNQSYLNSLSRKSFVEKLKNEYKFRINQTAYNWFVNNTDTLIIRGKTKYNRSSLPSGYLYSFANQHLTTKEFASYIEKRGSMIVTDDPAYFINRSIDARISDQIITYENSLLENKYPDFRYLMNEFHDGILLFEISGKKVWNRIQEDSTGLRDYYENNKQDFLSKKGIDAKVYTLRSAKGEKKLSSYYKKYSQKPETDYLLKRKFNKENDSILVITEGKWFEGDNPEMDSIKWTKGFQTTKINNYPSIVVINNVIDAEPLPFEAVKGEMMNGYQDYLENEWVKQLKERYNVKIDQQVLAEVKMSLIND